jgi:hypothetical protein
VFAALRGSSIWRYSVFRASKSPLTRRTRSGADFKLESASGWRSEPECEIAHVLFDVREPGAPSSCPAPRVPSRMRALRGRCVPVIVSEVVKARLSDPAPEKVAVGIARALEGDNQIE